MAPSFTVAGPPPNPRGRCLWGARLGGGALTRVLAGSPDLGSRAGQVQDRAAVAAGDYLCGALEVGVGQALHGHLPVFPADVTIHEVTAIRSAPWARVEIKPLTLG
ncbi:MAG: hypothetical protein ACRDRU_26585 [Pseudonocardiaceae bacterium]